ncbi:MAG TPA: aminotransferase class I/II-fold pyridoxal phosphate-dependent enzyme, partial [Candidatus Obscuribacter sp.]|nr:aminotransferase class I/II-fold pyridoxal phosphate-dependent enzyme [Candidatus Obscuribacter sp.]
MKLKQLLSLLTASICSCRSRVSKASGARFSAFRLDKLPLPKLRASSSGAQSAPSVSGKSAPQAHSGGALAAKGLALLDLSSGAPDSDTPDVLKQAAAQAIMNGDNQYGESNGDLELRRLYARRLTEQMTLTRNLAGVSSPAALADAACAIDPDTQVTVLNGTSSALAAVLLSTVDAGDEVLVFAPYFEGY